MINSRHISSCSCAAGVMNGTGTNTQLGCRSTATGCKEMPEHPHRMRLAEVCKGPAITRQFTSQGGSCCLQQCRLHPALPAISTMPGVPHIAGSEETQGSVTGGDMAMQHLASPLPALSLPKQLLQSSDYRRILCLGSKLSSYSVVAKQTLKKKHRTEKIKLQTTYY